MANVYVEFLSERLKEINPDNIPESYQEIVQRSIILEDIFKIGKIKYDDKILHKSRLIKYYTENIDKKKSTKRFR